MPPGGGQRRGEARGREGGAGWEGQTGRDWGNWDRINKKKIEY